MLAPTLYWVKSFLGKQETVKFEFGGNEGVLSVPAKTNIYVSLAAEGVDSPRIFEHLTSECKPIATRSETTLIKINTLVLAKFKDYSQKT